jgi:hypothetical protein
MPYGLWLWVCRPCNNNNNTLILRLLAAAASRPPRTWVWVVNFLLFFAPRALEHLATCPIPSYRTGQLITKCYGVQSRLYWPAILGTGSSTRLTAARPGGSCGAASQFGHETQDLLGQMFGIALNQQNTQTNAVQCVVIDCPRLRL